MLLEGAASLSEDAVISVLVLVAAVLVEDAVISVLEVVAAALVEDAEVVLVLVATALVEDAEVVVLELVPTEDELLETIYNNLPIPPTPPYPLPPPDELTHNFSYNSPSFAFSYVNNTSLRVGTHCE